MASDGIAAFEATFFWRNEKGKKTLILNLQSVYLVLLLVDALLEAIETGGVKRGVRL